MSQRDRTEEVVEAMARAVMTHRNPGGPLSDRWRTFAGFISEQERSARRDESAAAWEDYKRTAGYVELAGDMRAALASLPSDIRAAIRGETNG